MYFQWFREKIQEMAGFALFFQWFREKFDEMAGLAVCFPLV